MSKSEEMLNILKKAANIPEEAEIIEVKNLYANTNDLYITYEINGIKCEKQFIYEFVYEPVYKKGRFGIKRYIGEQIIESPSMKAIGEICALVGIDAPIRMTYDKENGWNIKG